MGKVLILIDNLYRQYGLNGVIEQNVLFLPMLRKESENKLYRALRKIHLSSLLPFKEVWLGIWIKKCQDFDTIILADAGNTFNVVRYIRKRYPQKRIIVWYRNPVEATVKPNKKIKQICELWSFDPEDCRKYKMRYNPQFYIMKSCPMEKKLYDVFFVGQDKGRLSQLLLIEKKIQELGYRTKFCIVGYNSKRLSYDKILEYISESKVILDWKCAGQSGLTLRPMEALFYKKKLITNDENIRNYDFYQPSNFLVWNNNMKELEVFFRKTYVETAEDVLSQYRLLGWVRRFFS